MNNELRKYKKSDKIKWIFTGIAFVLIFVFLAGLCMQLFAKNDKYKPSEWFKKDETEHLQPDKNDENETPEAAAFSFITPRRVIKASSATANNDSGISAQSEVLTPNFYGSGTVYNDWNRGQGGIYYKDDTGSIIKVGTLYLSRFCEKVGTPPTITYYEYYLYSFSFESGNTADMFCNYTMYKSFEISGTSSTSNGVPVTSNILNGFTKFDKTQVSAEFTGNAVNPTGAYITCMRVESLPDDPVKEGHTFVGWYYDSAFTRPYDGEALTEDINLYAKFEINNFTVTFNSNGGSSIENQTVNWNSIASLSTPTRAGYIFKGWFLSDGTEYKNQPITKDITLTAHWEIIMCTVTFYIGEEVFTTKTVEYGTPLIKIVESANDLTLRVLSVRSANGDLSNSDIAKLTVTDDSVEIVTEELTGADKVVNTVKSNKWAIIGGVAGGVALIAILGAVIGGTKRRKR